MWGVAGALGSIAAGGVKRYGLTAFTIGSAATMYRDYRGKGESTFSSASKTAFWSAFPLVAPTTFGYTIGIAAIPTVIGAAYSMYRRQSGVVRQTTMPFSHKFEHSDVTASLQQQALQRLGAGYHAGMGMEASRMTARYMRN